MSQKNSSKISLNFVCELCDYTSSKKCDFNKHLTTRKHKNASYMLENASKKVDEGNFICNCGKSYTHDSSYYRHKKSCIIKNENNIVINEVLNEPTDKELVMMLLKQNNELIKEQSDIKQIILEIVKQGTTNTTNNNITHTNSHNKAFNLNFFLNETCKNAMNITEFVDSINLQLSDLEKVGEIGYIEGISNIIIKNLNALDETKRPLHCTDKKRETIYIKNEGQWEKEDDNKTKLKKLITKVSNKNIKLISQFREKYPECRKCESSISYKYNKMIIEAMGGPGDNNLEKEEKIIRNIAKEITINK